ncbi:MAG: hypothetical protein AAFY60_05415, partial [Myxococcota bacterium]
MTDSIRVQVPAGFDVGLVDTGSNAPAALDSASPSEPVGAPVDAFSTDPSGPAAPSLGPSPSSGESVADRGAQQVQSAAREVCTGNCVGCSCRKDDAMEIGAKPATSEHAEELRSNLSKPGGVLERAAKDGAQQAAQASE